MTREEAWNRIDIIIAKHEVDDMYVTITNASDYDALRYARKTLEQGSKTDILDKIKSEIRTLDDINPDYPMDRTIHINRNEVLGIIDKYRQEG